MISSSIYIRTAMYHLSPHSYEDVLLGSISDSIQPSPFFYLAPLSLSAPHLPLPA